MKICVIGNSVGLKIRPPRATPDEQTYSEILEAAGHCVKNVSKAGVLLREAYGLLEDEVITFFPDVVVINHGVVEVCYRTSVRSLNNAAIPNVYLNSVFGRDYAFVNSRVFRIVNVGRRAMNRAIRIGASALGLKWQWMRNEDFVEVVGATCALVQKETNARIFVMGITPSSSRVERMLTGTGERISSTNRLLRDYCAGAGPRIHFVDVEQFIAESDLTTMVPDGIHFSAAGHRMIAERLLQAIADTPAR